MVHVDTDCYQHPCVWLLVPHTALAVAKCICQLLKSSRGKSAYSRLDTARRVQHCSNSHQQNVEKARVLLAHSARERAAVLCEASQELPVCRRAGARLHSSRAASAEPWLASSATSALGLASCCPNLVRLAVSSLRARLMTASEGCCVNCNSALAYVPPFMTCTSDW